MRPSSFDYHRATSVADAVQALSKADGAKPLAGGHSLIPAMNLRLAQPDAIVDIGRLDELRGIRVENGKLFIGALTTHAEVASSADVQQHAPALASAASKVGDHMVRNRGTLGGNLAHSDPASDPPTVVLAYEGVIHTQSPSGKRAIPARDFFVDALTVDLQPGELITTIEIPSHAHHKSAYVKMPHPASRYALVGVCVVLAMDGDNCTGARVTVGGAVPKATLSHAADVELKGHTINETTLEAAAEALVNDVGDEVIGDIFAPEDYRKAMIGVYFKRAVHAALGK